jgi:hypothetical protein
MLMHLKNRSSLKEGGGDDGLHVGDMWMLVHGVSLSSFCCLSWGIIWTAINAVIVALVFTKVLKGRAFLFLLSIACCTAYLMV